MTSRHQSPHSYSIEKHVATVSHAIDLALQDGATYQDLVSIPSISSKNTILVVYKPANQPKAACMVISATTPVNNLAFMLDNAFPLKP